MSGSWEERERERKGGRKKERSDREKIEGRCSRR